MADEDRVECYSGHTYAQEPRAVHWQGLRYPVVQVEGRWRTPAGPAFRVQTESGTVFDLRYHELEDRWRIFPQAGQVRRKLESGESRPTSAEDTDLRRET